MYSLSISIGLEDLDFPTWRQAVVHWNLPSSPVDLEQCEGHVHHHAVSKSIAECYGLGTQQNSGLEQHAGGPLRAGRRTNG